MKSADGDDLWGYATTLYARPGVAASCLVLQDEHQLDVNVLLYCFWLAGGESNAAAVDWPSLVAETSRWQACVVSPLRSLRRRLKVQATLGERASFLRDRLMDCELRAEAVEQAALPGWSGSPPVPPPALIPSQAAAQHLSAYCRTLNLPLADALIEALARLLAQVYDLSPANARALLAAAT